MKDLNNVTSEDEKTIELTDKSPAEDPYIEDEGQRKRPLTPDELRTKKSIEELLDDTSHGTIISIYRKLPGWCAGWVDSVEYDLESEEPFDLRWLSETWGGELFDLKFRKNGRYSFSKRVRIAGPPRKHCKLLESPEQKEERRWREDRLLPSEKPPQEDGKLINTIIPLLIKQLTSKDTETFQMMQETLQKAVPTSDFGKFKEVFEMFEMIKDLQGEKANGGNDMNTMLAGLMEVLKQQKAAPQPPSPVRVMKGPVAPMPGQPQMPSPQLTPLTQPVQPVLKDSLSSEPPQNELQKPVPAELITAPEPEEEEDLPSVAEEFANMELGELNETLNEAVELMSPEKRIELFKGLSTIDFKSMVGEIEKDVDDTGEALPGS